LDSMINTACTNPLQSAVKNFLPTGDEKADNGNFAECFNSTAGRLRNV